MALTADNVVVAVTGSLNRAPVNSTLPVNATSALDAAFVDQGYLSEDGVTMTIDSQTTDIVAWQNADVVRTVQTSNNVTLQATMIESMDEVFKTFFGNYNLTGGVGATTITGAALPKSAFVLNVLDGINKIRLVIPNGQINERGDVVFQNGEAVGYPVTITAYPDANGVKVYMYVDGGIESA